MWRHRLANPVGFINNDAQEERGLLLCLLNLCPCSTRLPWPATNGAMSQAYDLAVDNPNYSQTLTVRNACLKPVRFDSGMTGLHAELGELARDRPTEVRPANGHLPFRQG